MTDWRPLARALADTLVDSGAVNDPAWRAVFAATPRHLFVPRFWKLDKYNQPRKLVDGTDPSRRDEWLTEVYRNQVLVTHYRVIGAMPDGQEVRLATSSASMPALVAMMLDRLAVEDGQRVLEIGTGTGYHAALLAARLGEAKVTSVEVDPVTAGEAVHQLRAAGLAPTVVVGDGAGGYPPRAPYDRIIATCAVGHVPAAWPAQLADDGLIVVPFTFAGALAVLRKSDAGTVSGRFDARQAYFMALRPAADAAATVPDIPPGDEPFESAHTRVEPAAWNDPDFRLWLTLHLPEAQVAEILGEESDRSGITVYTSAHRATADYSDAGSKVETAAKTWPVTQDRGRLWERVEQAWLSWVCHGRPDRTRLGITAEPGGGQYVWLDDDPGVRRWRLPGARSGTASTSERAG